MSSYRTAAVICLLTFAASAAAIVVRPGKKTADERPAIALATMVPSGFGDWRELPQTGAQVVNPQAQEMLDRIYSEVLARVYADASGYRVMLSIAYGSDQRRGLQAHKPEVCYPAQGFALHDNKPGVVSTSFGAIPVRRLFATLGARQEPITYWFTVGDRTVRGSTEKRLVDLKLGLTGRIPDGILFRVSSIDGDLGRAYAHQERFVEQLLGALTPAERRRLSGLEGEPALKTADR